MGKKKGGKNAGSSEETKSGPVSEPGPDEATPLIAQEDLEAGKRGRLSDVEYGDVIVSRMRQSQWYFGYCIVCTVLATFLIVSMISDLVHPVHTAAWFLVAEAVITVCIVGEVAVVGWYLGCRPKDPWYVFDVVVAIISIIAFIMDLVLAAMAWQMDEYVLAVLALRYCIQAARLLKFFKDAWRAKTEQDAADEGIIKFGNTDRFSTGGSSK